MPSIATRTGDDGTTSLLFGQRVPKNHPQIEAVGAFDELNAALGLVKAHLPASPSLEEWRELLPAIQKNLVALMGEVACAESDVARYQASTFEKLTDRDVARLDAAVASLESRGLKFDDWATPGANPTSAAFDIARTHCPAGGTPPARFAKPRPLGPARAETIRQSAIRPPLAARAGDKSRNKTARKPAASAAGRGR